jgi:hypothetical protein
MTERIARGVSVVLHPLFFPFYVLLFFLNQERITTFFIPVRSQLILSAIVFLSTIALPLSTVLILYKMDLISSMKLKIQKERIYPLLVIAVYYFLTYWLLRGFAFSLLFSIYMLGSTILAVVSMILSQWTKISLHMTGAGGILGVLCGLSYNKLAGDLLPMILAVILVCGVVGSARLADDSHKPVEVYSGFFSGWIVMFGLFGLI